MRGSSGVAIGDASPLYRTRAMDLLVALGLRLTLCVHVGFVTSANGLGSLYTLGNTCRVCLSLVRQV